jgi:hypothetical protein
VREPWHVSNALGTGSAGRTFILFAHRVNKVAKDKKGGNVAHLSYLFHAGRQIPLAMLVALASSLCVLRGGTAAARGGGMAA